MVLSIIFHTIYNAEFFTDYWVFGVFDSNDLNENR